MTMTTTEHSKDEQNEHEARPLGRRRRTAADYVVMKKIEKDMAAKSSFSPGVIFAGVASGLAVIFSVMSWINSSTVDKLAPVTTAIDGLDKRITSQLTEMDKRYTARMDSMDKRLDRLEVRADKVDDRLGKIETRLESMDGKIDRILDATKRR